MNRCPLNFYGKKLDNTSFDFFLNFDPYSAQKIKTKGFLPQNPLLVLFWSKIIRKHPRHLDKRIHSLKNSKKYPESQNQLVTKSLTKLKYFFRPFKGKTTLKLNFSYQIEPFDTKINYFDDQNRCQKYFFISIAEIQWLSLFSLKPKTFLKK